ncbi:MAG: DUF4878 domain-containing protein [Armatimonadetes bacterium]|nr:DUF4878 domain-containing protein [Armatimonadota bacterium]
MIRSGKTKWWILPLVAAVGLISYLVFFSGDTPSAAATRFMSALAKGDVKELTKLSYISGKSPEEIEKAWTYTTQVASPHYLFGWRVVSSQTVDEKNANVKIDVIRDALKQSAYSEHYGLAMVKDEGVWKVDVKAISREVYPFLPR